MSEYDKIVNELLRNKNEENIVSFALKWGITKDTILMFDFYKKIYDVGNEEENDAEIMIKNLLKILKINIRKRKWRRKKL